MADPQAQSPPDGSSGQERELRDAREQPGASREILVVLGRAGANAGEILDSVVEQAERLHGAHVGQLDLREGELCRLSRITGDRPDEFRRQLGFSRSVRVHDVGALDQNQVNT